MAKITMKTPYSSLVGKKNNPSNNYLMLSELIDNSIGSWKESEFSENILKVKIFLDMENLEITAIDNAAGMNKKQLEESVKLNKEKTGNVLNMFGVGMKNAAFWYGKDLFIYSSTGKKTLETSVVISQKNDLSLPVEWEVTESKTKILGHGTKIIIGALHEDRNITPNQFEKLVKILSKKYENYLEGEMVEITIEYKKDSNTDLKVNKLVSLPTPAQEIDAKLSAEVVKQINVYYDTFKRSNEIKYLKGIQEKAIEAAVNNERMEFWFILDIKGPLAKEGSPVALKIGIQQEAKTFDDLYGVTTFQSDRAINFAPENALPLGEKIRTNIKRVYASLELGDVFRPDNNKYAFNYGVYEEDFLDIIATIGKEILPLADAMFNVYSTRRSVKKGNTGPQKAKVANMVAAKIKDDVMFSMSAKGGSFTFKSPEGKYKFYIIEKSITNQNADAYFITAKEIVKEENSFKIEFNIDHPIWKPLMTSAAEGGTNKISVKTVIYPLVAIIGISSIGMNTKIISELLGKNSIDLTSYAQLISEVAKKTFK